MSVSVLVLRSWYYGPEFFLRQLLEDEFGLKGDFFEIRTRVRIRAIRIFGPWEKYSPFSTPIFTNKGSKWDPKFLIMIFAKILKFLKI